MTKVTPTATNARIVCCAGQALEADFTGVIRQQDVRAHEVDKVGAGAGRVACSHTHRHAYDRGGSFTWHQDRHDHERRRGTGGSVSPSHAPPSLLLSCGASSGSAEHTSSRPCSRLLMLTNATHTPQVVMYDCFRPGDVVRARVLSLGDARSYHLTTADNSLGVVHARSLAGVPMVALSWQEMRCPRTMVVERRKVAKV